MNDLSQHFNRREFKCKCGECDREGVDYRLVLLLERLRVHTNSAIVITSGNRCEAYNKKVGGSPTSRHRLSTAADIQVKGHSPELIYEILDDWYPYTYGIIIYKSWVHVDTRTNRYRDDKR